MVRARQAMVATFGALTTLSGPRARVESPGAAWSRIGLPGVAAWQAARSTGRLLPDPLTTAPASVAAFFAGLPRRERVDLARAFPALVGNLDGVPPTLRFAANRYEVVVSKVATGVNLRGRRILALDPRDRGLAVEVFGDLRTATRVAVIVPGAGADLHHLDGEGGVATAGRALLAEAERQRPGSRLAVIAWAGYTTPTAPVPSGAQGGLARHGAARLQRFLSGLTAYTRAPIGLLCHSYGSVVCGLSRLPRQVSDIAVFGSPGVRAESARALSSTARVWAGLAAGDPVRWLPTLRFGDYGHGRNPVEPAFGARVFATHGARGHSCYFATDTDSLRNLARIALGHCEAVTFAPAPPFRVQGARPGRYGSGRGNGQGLT